MNRKLSKAGPLIRVDVVSKATLATVAQTIVVSAVTQHTDVLTATVAFAARVRHCETRKKHVILSHHCCFSVLVHQLINQLSY